MAAGGGSAVDGAADEAGAPARASAGEAAAAGAATGKPAKGGEAALRLALVEAGRSLDARGWVMGTSGNLSARLDDGAVLITRSGRHKGRLTLDDFVADGRAGEAAKPSAEVSIHRAVYAALPSTRAIVHAHSVATTLASLRVDPGEGEAWLPLPPVEMLKGLDVWDADAPVPLLVLPNHRDVPRIAQALAPRLADLRLPGFLIRGHGGTTWGRSVEEALHRMETLDFLCEVCLRLARP